MDRSQTAEAISGRATGVLFFAGFGTLWFCTGLAAMHRLNLGTGAVAAIILAGLVVSALRVLKRSSALPKQTVDPEVEAQISRTFNRANTAQWIAIPVAVVLLNIVHQTAYIVPAIATIVGLHLFPLARAFRYPMHYVTGALLVLWSAPPVRPQVFRKTPRKPRQSVVRALAKNSCDSVSPWLKKSPSLEPPNSAVVASKRFDRPPGFGL